jgi:hypothetical protein
VQKSTGLQSATQKLLAANNSGIELVSEVGREDKGAHNLTASEKGMTMHTTIFTKQVARMGCASWLEGLSASLVSFLAVAQPHWALQYAGRQPRKALHTGCALALSAHPFAMLVASDVNRRSYGLVP